ncbi:MAG: AmmeMemoRadiSam system protein A [archaeon]
MNDKDKKLLLKLARESISTYFSGKKPDMSETKHLTEKRGVFVTLHEKRGKLRGCIGFPTPAYSLCTAIAEAARSAAFQDPRFKQLSQPELNDIYIEISVLTVPELIKVTHSNDYLKMIKIGEDGLIIEGSYGSGLLLPQVATENAFSIQQFLNCLCQKAGLGFNDWKDISNKIYKFQAIIFSEKKKED